MSHLSSFVSFIAPARYEEHEGGWHKWQSKPTITQQRADAEPVLRGPK